MLEKKLAAVAQVEERESKLIAEENPERPARG